MQAVARTDSVPGAMHPVVGAPLLAAPLPSVPCPVAYPLQRLVPCVVIDMGRSGQPNSGDADTLSAQRRLRLGLAAAIKLSNNFTAATRAHTLPIRNCLISLKEFDVLTFWRISSSETRQTARFGRDFLPNSQETPNALPPFPSPRPGRRCHRSQLPRHWPGHRETTLKARDINGNAVALNSASAAFFYDETLKVTWLANMNQNGTTMNWSGAVAWAGALTTGGFTDWRLPTIIDSGTAGCNFSFDGGTDCGYSVQTQVGSAYSEWAHLFYLTLGNLGYCAPGGGTPSTCEGPQSGWGLTNTAYFQNMQSSAYWSGTEYVSPGSGDAWLLQYLRRRPGLPRRRDQ